MQATIDTTIDHLNVLLRGELSAIETYEQAIDRLEAPTALTALARLRSRHVERADRLADLVEVRGGRAAESSGLWGAFVEAVEGTAARLGASAALAALEQGEEHNLEAYASEWTELDPPARRIVASDLMPAQLHTLQMLRHLRAEVDRASRN